jgi:hypothetical protein
MIGSRPEVPEVSAMTHEEFVRAHKARRVSVKVRNQDWFLTRVLSRGDLPPDTRARIGRRCRRDVIGLAIWVTVAVLAGICYLVTRDTLVGTIAWVALILGAIVRYVDWPRRPGRLIRNLALEDERFYRIAVESGVLEIKERGR